MKKILVVEDTPALREALCEALRRKGYEVFEASNGKEGTEIYRAKLPDLLITDILMPEKDGAETVFELLKEFPALKVIVISGGGIGSAEEYLKAITAYTNIKHAFVKPFPMMDMLNAVESLLNEH